MKSFLFYFAVTGWSLGIIVHSLALTGIDATSKIPFVWLLHLGIFVVWLPAVLKMGTNPGADHNNPITSFKAIFKHTPPWISTIAIGGFYYAIINFVLFLTSQEGSPDIVDGQYVLRDHGQVLRSLTREEYQFLLANQVRGFSGHWIAFYGLAAAVLYPFGGQTDEAPKQVPADPHRQVV